MKEKVKGRKWGGMFFGAEVETLILSSELAHIHSL